MVGFNQVSQFVDDYIIDYEHWGFDETPVKTYIVLNRAGTPAITVIDDSGASKHHTEFNSADSQCRRHWFLLWFGEASSGCTPVAMRAAARLLPAA